MNHWRKSLNSKVNRDALMISTRMFQTQKKDHKGGVCGDHAEDLAYLTNWENQTVYGGSRLNFKGAGR